MVISTVEKIKEDRELRVWGVFYIWCKERRPNWKVTFVQRHAPREKVFEGEIQG